MLEHAIRMGWASCAIVYLCIKGAEFLIKEWDSFAALIEIINDGDC